MIFIIYVLLATTPSSTIDAPDLGYAELWRLQHDFYNRWIVPNNVKETESTIFVEDASGSACHTNALNPRLRIGFPYIRRQGAQYRVHIWSLHALRLHFYHWAASRVRSDTICGAEKRCRSHDSRQFHRSGVSVYFSASSDQHLDDL